MRTLVLSDLHGNLAALNAVLAAEPHDQLIVLGDLVGFGPRPDACVRRIREANAICVQGNHDLAHATDRPPGANGPFAELASATQEVGRRLLSPADLSYLGDLPRWLFVGLGGLTALVVHATPSDPLHGHLDPGAHEWEREVHGVSAALLLVGHTHVQYERWFGGVRVVNPGSVGLPLDGDCRAAYAIVEDGEITLWRLAYPVDRTVDELRALRLHPASTALLGRILRAGSLPKPGRGAEDPKQSGVQGPDGGEELTPYRVVRALDPGLCHG